MLPFTWLEEADKRLASHLTITPLSYDADLNLYLEWENHQATGSLIARGALNNALNLHDWERERGLVTASAGNHGKGLALAANKLGAKVIVLSEKAVPAERVLHQISPVGNLTWYVRIGGSEL